MQTDGNLVMFCDVYPPFKYWKVHWASGPYGFRPARGGLMFQTDGNLVIYEYNGRVRWSTHTDHTIADSLIVQDDGNLVLYGPGPHHHRVFWSTGTHNRCGR